MDHLHLAFYLSVLYLARVNGDTWESFHLTFGQFNNVPLTVAALEADNYTLVATDDELALDFFTYMDDPRVAVGVDRRGNVAGIRVNLIKADIEKKAEENNLTFPFDFADKEMYTYGVILDTEVYYTTVLFRNPAISSAFGQNVNSGVLEVEDVYVRLNGEWAVVPKDECEATAHGFVKEGCIPSMGVHYFYGMSAALDCADWQGVFGLYNKGSLIGLGLPTHGYQTVGADRTWFEQPTSLALQYIIPNERASCVTDWTDKYGMTSIHIYFTEDPASIACSSIETVC